MTEFITENLEVLVGLGATALTACATACISMFFSWLKTKSKSTQQTANLQELEAKLIAKASLTNDETKALVESGMEKILKLLVENFDLIKQSKITEQELLTDILDSAKVVDPNASVE